MSCPWRLLVLFVFVAKVVCFTPNCVPENQFKFYRFPVQGCSDNFLEKCKFHPSGYFKALGDATLVKIGETEVLPTCAFSNVNGLKRIYGVNSKIKVLASRAFSDLYQMDGIHLSFNSITELREGVFHNVTVNLLDLSWNKLVFIDSRGFSGIEGLKSLNLSKNSLMTLAINSLPSSIGYLNLAHNLLTRVALNSHKFSNLTAIDLSNNLIEKMALLFSYPIEYMDFTSNRLENFDYIEIPSVDMFRIGKNQFETVPKYLENLNAKQIDLYPNPWKCDQLFLLWETLVSFGIRLAPKEVGKNPPAECFTSGKDLSVTTTRTTPCLDDFECPDNMVCRTRKCWDPCDNSVCHTSSVCETKQHQFKCSCVPLFRSDPLDIRGACQNVDCFVNADCVSGEFCWDHKCVGKQAENDRPLIIGGHAVQRPTTFRPVPSDSESEIQDHILDSRSEPWWFEDIPNYTPKLVQNTTVTNVTSL